MTSAEHLIENALVALEEGKSFDDFKNHYAVEADAKCLNFTDVELGYVWEMANYILYSYCCCCEKRRANNGQRKITSR